MVTPGKENVHPPNKVPSLEHNGKIIGESLVDSNFEGPSLFPHDPEKKKFVDELFSYIDPLFTSFKGDPAEEIGAALDGLEERLGKFDGPFFLGQFSWVDIAYIPFVERFKFLLPEGSKIDITTGRPKLAVWIEELNKTDAYTQTKTNPKELNKVIGKIIGDSNFDWSLLFPDDPEKKFAEELVSDIGTFVGTLCSSFKGNSAKETALHLCHWFRVAVGAALVLPVMPVLLPAMPVVLPPLLVVLHALHALPVALHALPVASGAARLTQPKKMVRLTRPKQVVPCVENPKSIEGVFDYLENALHKFDDGPFFLGRFSLVDIACFTFVERFKILLPEGSKIDSKSDWPKLAAWIKELNKITQTKTDPKEPVEFYKNRVQPQKK